MLDNVEEHDHDHAEDDENQEYTLDAIVKWVKGGKGKGRGKVDPKGKGNKDKDKGAECWRCGKANHRQPDCVAKKDRLQAPLAEGDKNRFRPLSLKNLE